MRKVRKQSVQLELSRCSRPSIFRGAALHWSKMKRAASQQRRSGWQRFHQDHFGQMDWLSCKIGFLIYFNLFFEMYNKKWKFLNLVNLFWSNFIWNNWNEKESMEHAAPYVAATFPPPPSALFFNKTNFITKKKITKTIQEKIVVFSVPNSLAS